MVVEEEVLVFNHTKRLCASAGCSVRLSVFFLFVCLCGCKCQWRRKSLPRAWRRTRMRRRDEGEEEALVVTQGEEREP